MPIVLGMSLGPVPGFAGFAVGRTLWQHALERYVAGTWSREETRREIADRYLRTIRAYVQDRGRDQREEAS